MLAPENSDKPTDPASPTVAPPVATKPTLPSSPSTGARTEHAAGGRPQETKAQQVSRIRREAGRDSLRVFAETYLSGHFNKPPSRMHLDLYRMLEEAGAKRGARLAVAAPRGHAKSTLVTLALVLWSICYRKEDYIAIISNTVEQAADQLSHVKAELINNERLIEDFPEACEVPGQKPGPDRWRKAEICTRTVRTVDENRNRVTRDGVKVTALGKGSQIRGRKNKSKRPSLIILDDVETDAEVRSEEQRSSVRQWFNQAVCNAGSSHTNIIVVGTILHHHSLLATLLKPEQSPGWTGRKYQAIEPDGMAVRGDLWERWESILVRREEHEGRTGNDAAMAYFEACREAMLEGTKVLWPEQEDYLRLMQLRVELGRAAFNTEKLNNPTSPEDCLFDDASFQYWDDQHKTVEDLLAAMPGRLRIYGACDPSLGKAGRNHDDTAIVTIVKDTKTKVMYVIEADIRRLKPDAIIESIIARRRIWKYTSFIMEENQYQEFLGNELRRRASAGGVPMTVKRVVNTADKLGRVQSLQPYVHTGMVKFSRRQHALLDQLREFPHGARDDGPDALEMAVREATKGVPQISVWWPGKADRDGDDDGAGVRDGSGGGPFSSGPGRVIAMEPASYNPGYRYFWER